MSSVTRSPPCDHPSVTTCIDVDKPSRPKCDECGQRVPNPKPADVSDGRMIQRLKAHDAALAFIRAIDNGDIHHDDRVTALADLLSVARRSAP